MIAFGVWSLLADVFKRISAKLENAEQINHKRKNLRITLYKKKVKEGRKEGKEG